MITHIRKAHTHMRAHAYTYTHMCKCARTHPCLHTHREIQNVHTMSHCMYLKVNHFLGSRGFGILAIIVDFQLFLPDLFLCVSYRHTNEYKINYVQLSFYSLENKFFFCHLFYLHTHTHTHAHTHTHTSIFIHSQINIKNINLRWFIVKQCNIDSWNPPQPPVHIHKTCSQHFKKKRECTNKTNKIPPQNKNIKRLQFRLQLWWTDASTPYVPPNNNKRPPANPTLKKRSKQSNISLLWLLTEFSLHFLTATNFVHKFSLKGVDIRIQLK